MVGETNGRAWASTLALLLVAGCSGSDGSSNNGNNDNNQIVGTSLRAQTLQSIADRVIVPAAQDFATAAAALQTAVDAYQSAVAADAGVEDARATAQARFGEAAAAWQQLELMQVGPNGSSLLRVEGADIRDEVYSWPTVNSCRVDQLVVEEGYAASDFVSSNLVNVYGLDALEYLLFWTSDENTCSPVLRINEGPWQDLGAETVRTRRAAYAQVVAAQVRAEADRLVQVWSADGDNFALSLAAAGSSGSPYDSEMEALDEVFAAMYYIELRTKDLKLAIPAGISSQCSADTCPDDLESEFAEASKAHVAANLEATKRLFHGGDPSDTDAVGFVDLLEDAGAGSLATSMDAALDQAIQANEAVSGSYRSALESSPESVRAVHDATKAFTDLLKTQFVSVLGLRVPDEGAGDND